MMKTVLGNYCWIWILVASIAFRSWKSTYLTDFCWLLFEMISYYDFRNYVFGKSARSVGGAWTVWDSPFLVTCFVHVLLQCMISTVDGTSLAPIHWTHTNPMWVYILHMCLLHHLNIHGVNFCTLSIPFSSYLVPRCHCATLPNESSVYCTLTYKMIDTFSTGDPYLRRRRYGIRRARWGTMIGNLGFYLGYLGNWGKSVARIIYANYTIWNGFGLNVYLVDQIFAKLKTCRVYNMHAWLAPINL